QEGGIVVPPAAGWFIFVQDSPTSGHPEWEYEADGVRHRRPVTVTRNEGRPIYGALAEGLPPAACTWVPRDWPVAWFPLGLTPDHLRAWGIAVRSALSAAERTPRTSLGPDDPELGWRTLTRATRLLARQLSVVDEAWVLAAWPATPAEALCEAGPLLDGLVEFAARANAPLGRAADNPPSPPGDGGERNAVTIIPGAITCGDHRRGLSGRPWAILAALAGAEHPTRRAASLWRL